MAKILKNTTLSDIELKEVGLTVPASSQITVPVTDYLLLASEDSITELTTLINNGDIVVNDGSSDLSKERAISCISYQDNFKTNSTLYVDPAGSDSTGDGSANNPFATLTGAYNAINNGDVPNTSNDSVAIVMGAGSYNQAPVDFSGLSCELAIQGFGPRTDIVPTNNSADLLTFGSRVSIFNLAVNAPSSTSHYAVRFETTGTGIASTSGLSFGSGGTRANGVIATSSGGTYRLTLRDTLANQLTNDAVTADTGAIITIANFIGIGNGVNSKALVQNNDGEIRLIGGRLTNYNIGIQVNGNDGFLTLEGLNAPGTTIPLDQNGTSQIELLGGDFDASNAQIIDTSVIDGYFINQLPEENQFRVISELSVGLPNRGRESAFGEGDSYTNGMQVYTYNGSTYTDVSEDAASITASTFTFPNTNVNSAIYVSTAFDTANPLKFFGIKINCQTAAVLGSGDIVFEYWNGSSWVEFNHMLVDTVGPYLSYANSKFGETSTKQVMFDRTITDDWTVNDPVTLGVNLYWIRFRIDTASITTAPVFEQFKIHTNRLELDVDGTQLMYGTARIEEKFPVAFSGFAPTVGKAPNNQDIFLSDQLAVALTRNSFPTNQDRAIVFNQFIPFELDTSCPMFLTFSYFGDSNTAGDVQWAIRWATDVEGALVYKSTATAPTTYSNERSSTTVVSYPGSEANVTRTVEFSLEIPEAISQQFGGKPQSKIWIQIKRDVSGADTYGGNIILTDLALYFTAWREGGYTGEF